MYIFQIGTKVGVKNILRLNLTFFCVIICLFFSKCLFYWIGKPTDGGEVIGNKSFLRPICDR